MFYGYKCKTRGYNYEKHGDKVIYANICLNGTDISRKHTDKLRITADKVDNLGNEFY